MRPSPQISPNARFADSGSRSPLSPSAADGTAPSAGQPTAEDLVAQHLPLVGHLVRETLGRVPGQVSRDELVSAGMLALVQASQAFDTTRGASFATYASTRIRGAIIDELRGMDWASRSVRRRAREVDEAYSRVSTDLGRPAERHEVASALGVGTAELAAHQNDLTRASLVSLQSFEDGGVDDLLPASTATPVDVMEHREQVAYLHDAVEHLPERLRTVVEGYFFHDRPMADIAAELGVHESRVSQMRAEAVGLLRGALTAALMPELAEVHERPNGCSARRKESYYASVAAHRTFSARLSAPTQTGTFSA